MDKKSYKIDIADVNLAIRSDEKEETIKKIVSDLDTQIRDLCVNNKQCSKLDAAVLCCLDYSCENIKAEKRIRNLEAQISLYDANLKRLHAELDKATEKAAKKIPEEKTERPAAATEEKKQEKRPEVKSDKVDAEKAEKKEEKAEPPKKHEINEKKIEEIESLLKRKKTFQESTSDPDQNDKNMKIQEIDALLRRNDKN